MQRLLTFAIGLYTRYLSPFMVPRCRYLPTCSEYAREAIDRHGVHLGSWLALKRLCRCQPFGAHGHDPVPPRREAHSHG